MVLNLKDGPSRDEKEAQKGKCFSFAEVSELADEQD